jgi:hypothetical protein
MTVMSKVKKVVKNVEAAVSKDTQAAVTQVRVVEVTAVQDLKAFIAHLRERMHRTRTWTPADEAKFKSL